MADATLTGRGTRSPSRRRRIIDIGTLSTVRKLYRGQLGPSGIAIARWVEVTVTASMVISNLFGAAAVFVLASWVIPLPRLPHPLEVRITNLVALGLYGIIAVTFGILWGKRRFTVGQAWMLQDLPPTEDEKRALLRAPLRMVSIPAFFWVLAVALFTGVNALFSLTLARVVGSTVALGAVTTCTVAYLLSERFLRPAAARALSYGRHEDLTLLGVGSRTLLGWGLGTGIPVMGLVLVAVTALTGIPATREQLSVTILGLGGLAVVVGFVVTVLLAHSLSDPINELRHGLRRVEKGDLDFELPVYDGTEIGGLQAGFNQMIAGLRERERIRDLFGRQVGEEVADAAVSGGIEIGGDLRDVAVLFTDMIGSTALTQSRQPREVIGIINSFLQVVVRNADRSGGWVNKFEGDAALVVFGAPLAMEDHCGGALAAARTIAADLQRELPDYPVAIGVSAGRAVAGHFGHESRYEYTVIGDPVNEAARLTELAKTTPGRVLASEAVVKGAAPEEARCWQLGDAVLLRGREEATRLAMPV